MSHCGCSNVGGSGNSSNYRPNTNRRQNDQLQQLLSDPKVQSLLANISTGSSNSNFGFNSNF